MPSFDLTGIVGVVDIIDSTSTEDSDDKSALGLFQVKGDEMRKFSQKVREIFHLDEDPEYPVNDIRTFDGRTAELKIFDEEILTKNIDPIETLTCTIRLEQN